MVCATNIVVCSEPSSGICSETPSAIEIGMSGMTVSRERDRETERDRDRDRETDRQRQRERGRQTKREVINVTNSL